MSTFTRPGKAKCATQKWYPQWAPVPGCSITHSKVMDPSGSSAVLTQPPLEDVGIPGMSGDSQATGNGMEMGWKWDGNGMEMGC